WTREEDQLLMVGVRVYGPNTESWPRIAMLVPGRTNKSCRKRWFHSLDPSLHKGPWTAEEDDLLRQRVAQYPSQWSRVAEGIPGRTDDQCAKRWRESLDPEIDRSKWRPEEDRLLLEKYAELGTQWQKIATFFQGRPGLHCRNRWRKIYR
ncbi:Homeodomain-like protein, partial [Coemansia mojavensis]